MLSGGAARDRGLRFRGRMQRLREHGGIVPQDRPGRAAYRPQRPGWRTSGERANARNRGPKVWYQVCMTATPADPAPLQILHPAALGQRQ